MKQTRRSATVKQVEKLWGKSIKVLREKKNIQQWQMAKQLGMTFSNYTKIERGIIGCRLGVAVQICGILGIGKIEIESGDNT